MSVAQHEAAARQTERQAADHRAAAAALVEAEARVCAGLSAADRQGSPFERTEDIASIAPLVETTGGKVRISRTTGAVVTLRATPGMTAEWLQRVVDCHLARTATLDVTDMPSCPLVPRGAVARVTSTGNGFAVAIRSDDDATAREIWREPAGCRASARAAGRCPMHTPSDRPTRLAFWLGVCVFAAVAVFFLWMFGFLLQWPTLVTLVMFPILVTVYVRLARREERAVAAELGETWARHAARTPRFFPRLRQGPTHAEA